MRRQKLTEQQLVELGQRLITAASKGDCASAEEILKAGANVNFRDAKVCSSSSFICYVGALGRSISPLCVQTGSTALLIACSRGRRDGNSDLVRQLLAHPRIDVNAQNSTDKTAVIIATVFAHVETVGTLLQHSTQPDLSIQDYEGMTALMHAVVIDHVQLIRMLLSTQQTTRLDVVSKVQFNFIIVWQIVFSFWFM
jgi:ankyrin repeat protein